MKYLFILGRNIPLSIAEVFSFFNRSGIKILNHKIVNNGLLVEVDKKIDNKAIDFLGGVISIGEIIGKNEPELESVDLYHGFNNKMSYILWNFTDSEDAFNQFSDYLKRRFRDEKLKAVEHRDPRSSKKIDEEYFVFEDSFGRIIQKCDYKELEERDMKKPVRRQELSISPRLAKIMINLSEVKAKGKLLDAFCGIGVILSEALLQGLEVVGIDVDKNAIEGAKKNIEWLGIKRNYKLINGDSRRVNIPKMDAMASEPDLGEILKKSQKEENARETLEKFEKLMVGVLNNLRKNISGKIVFSAPNIKTHNGRMGCDINRIISRTGLQLTAGPFSDLREGQIVGRDIYVLE